MKNAPKRKTAVGKAGSKSAAKPSKKSRPRPGKTDAGVGNGTLESSPRAGAETARPARPGRRAQQPKPAPKSQARTRKGRTKAPPEVTAVVSPEQAKESTEPVEKFALGPATSVKDKLTGAGIVPTSLPTCLLYTS
ncbi:MAG: hypothetical protein N3G20_04495, partial [Verrucomicrobiae bacterium]|nr:hypothetical protein [Verrucomicrobiae bacterium]